VDLLQGRVKEVGAKLETRLQPDLCSVPADPEGLHRALLNIISNAIDAVEERKNPTVGVVTQLEAEGEWARIIVVDNGVGIPSDKQPEIFKPFVSSKGARGTGLGLAVSRKILREHGGDILLQSQPGKGSRFILRLPLKSPLSNDNAGTGVDVRTLEPPEES
jgi:signal transduction histidine kinase